MTVCDQRFKLRSLLKKFILRFCPPSTIVHRQKQIPMLICYAAVSRWRCIFRLMWHISLKVHRHCGSATLNFVIVKRSARLCIISLLRCRSGPTLSLHYITINNILYAVKTLLDIHTLLQIKADECRTAVTRSPRGDTLHKNANCRLGIPSLIPTLPPVSR